jgi:hypothetical protein
LVALCVEPILFVAFDVRRKRRAPDPVDDFIEVAVRFESHYSSAALSPMKHFGSEFASRKLDPRARQQDSTRLNQRLPNERLYTTNQKNFHTTT